LYGGATGSPRLREISAELGRHALHAATLGFVHPEGHSLSFESPPPAEFDRAWRRIR
jgi:23S rRNA pseudouridine1911/1915/1917 synthase